jgi:DinB superfamily
MFDGDVLDPAIEHQPFRTTPVLRQDGNTMAQLPDDLQDVLNQIDAADRAADVLVEDLSDAQFRWQPDGGRQWSIAQCLEHLGNMNVLYGGAARTGVELAQSKGWRRTGPIKSNPVGKWFIASQEPPVKLRLRSPSKVLPQSTKTRAEVLALYHDAHQRIRDMIHACADLDVNRATFTNPFISIIKVRVGTAVRIIAGHNRRHLWQAEQVKKAPGFPRS